MKITKSNYISSIKKVGIENLPYEMRQAHAYLMQMTNQGKDWSKINSNESLKSIADLAFEKLGEFMSHQELSGTRESLSVKRAKKDASEYPYMETSELKMIYRLEKDAIMEGDSTLEESKIRVKALEKELKNRDKNWLEQFKFDPEDYADLSGNKDSEESYDAYLEIQIMENYLALEGKIVVKYDIKPIIDKLQKAIKEKRIRAFSPYAKEIKEVQEELVRIYNSGKNSQKLVVTSALRKRLEKAMISYFDSRKDLKVDDKADPIDLSGTPSSVLKSTELTQVDFKTLGFDEKWLSLIGDPCAGFTAMIYGKPKMGKSYLAVDFAGYLARKFGKVLYVPKEEKFGLTFSTKLKDQDAAHENLIVSESIPDDLNGYDFIFLDSINSLNLSPEDLRQLKEKNPGKSFIYIFQTTKNGNFRGENTFQHDVDIVIEIPERGKAVQFGRFNQGGEMMIFGEQTSPAIEELSGTPTQKKYPAWTKPEHLSISDHKTLQHIYDLYKDKKYSEAMDYAMYNSDTVIREEIPGNIWKKLGGKLTPKGESKLLKKSLEKKAPNSPIKKKEKRTLYFHGGVRALKDLIQKQWQLEITDADFIEVLDVAESKNENFVDYADDLNANLHKIFSILKPAFDQWDKEKGSLKVRNLQKFNPDFYKNVKDDENPRFIFSLTSSKVLAEALNGDFDLIYMVRRELANRGQDHNGNWVGFDKAKELHRNEN